jgi:hypothetical protein
MRTIRGTSKYTFFLQNYDRIQSKSKITSLSKFQIVTRVCGRLQGWPFSKFICLDLFLFQNSHISINFFSNFFHGTLKSAFYCGPCPHQPLQQQLQRQRCLKGVGGRGRSIRGPPPDACHQLFLLSTGLLSVSTVAIIWRCPSTNTSATERIICGMVRSVAEVSSDVSVHISPSRIYVQISSRAPSRLRVAVYRSGTNS